MKRVTVSVVLLSLLGAAACGRDQPEPTNANVPTWSHVAPEQVAEAKKHGVPVAFENDLGMRFVLIPAGTFLMGSPEDEEGRGEDETQHEVTITKPYYMQITEVTNEAFRHHQLGHDAGELRWKDAAGSHRLTLDGDRQPATSISWMEASSFTAWLTGEDGAHSYRLPTEAEWEYACRAGTDSAYSFGESLTKEQASFTIWSATGAEPGTATVAVGSYRPNAWSLYDMHGNAYEWCADCVGPMSDSPEVDPKGPAGTAGTSRILRGGAASWGVRWAASAARYGAPSAFPDHTVSGAVMWGFRLVSPLPESNK